MKILRKLLFPFSILYGLITFIRNLLFDFGILKSFSFPIPIIAVGNLSVGGTGKSPQIEYLIRLLEKEGLKIATLSRGYKRKTKGFILANDKSNAETLGDEPFQIFKKFKNCIVAVDESRKNGIEKLLKLPNKPDVILLDDAFQHRKVKAGFYVLLTAYSDLFCNDFMLPTGNLREFTFGKKRANCIIVTKCPENISIEKQNLIKQKLKLVKNQTVFFSCINYDKNVFNEINSKSVEEIKNIEKILVAGIAKPNPFFDYLNSGNDTEIVFEDHHEFTETEIENFNKILASKIIVTTEKDYVRLENCKNTNLYYLPIETKFILNKSNFDQLILNFVKSLNR